MDKLEDKDAIIKQQWLLIRDQMATINKQRCRIAELEYREHRFDLIYTEPLRFLFWFWSSRIWPFSLIWGHNKVD